MSQGKTLILGFGSDALSDDGLPIRLVNDLKSALNQAYYDFNSSPVGGLELIYLLQGFDRAILIDTQLTGRHDPGYINLFSPADFEETFHLSSQHDLSFLDALRLAKEMEIPIPDDIRIIAIEIVENKKLGFEFSEEIEWIYKEIFKKINTIIKM